ncbi:MAG: hypothetical protein R3C14_14915 [Caldilineaceae bacterium]
MKTLIRVMIILLACLAVTGALYAVGQGRGANQALAGRFERPRGQALRGVDSQDALRGGEARENNNQSGVGRPPFSGEGRGREGLGREGFARGRGGQVLSLRSWLGFARTLLPIALVIGVVTLFAKLFKGRRRQLRSVSAEGVS